MKLVNYWILYLFLCDLLAWNKNILVVTETLGKEKNPSRLSEVFENVPHYVNDALQELQLTENALQSLNVIMSMVHLSMRKSSDSANGNPITDMGLITNVLKNKITHAQKDRLEKMLNIWKTKVLESPHFFIKKQSDDMASLKNKRKGNATRSALPYVFPKLPALFNN